MLHIPYKARLLLFLFSMPDFHSKSEIIAFKSDLRRRSSEMSELQLRPPLFGKRNPNSRLHVKRIATLVSERIILLVPAAGNENFELFDFLVEFLQEFKLDQFPSRIELGSEHTVVDIDDKRLFVALANDVDSVGVVEKNGVHGLTPST